MASCCCWWRVPIPTAGAGRAGRLTNRSWGRQKKGFNLGDINNSFQNHLVLIETLLTLHASCFSNLGATKDQGPMFWGSSWLHVNSVEEKNKITLKVKETWFTVFIYVSSLWLKFFSSVLTTERSNSRSNWNWIYFSAFEEVRTTKQRVTPELWRFVPEEDLIQNHNDICNNTKIARNPASEHTVTQQYFKQFTPFV